MATQLAIALVRVIVQPTCNSVRPFSLQMEEMLQGVTAPPVSGVQAKKRVGGAPSVRLTIAVKALALA